MRNLLALIASVGLIGCVGGIDDAPDGTIPPGTNTGPSVPGADLTEAKRLYDTNVHSVMVAKCSGGGCHSDTAQGATLTRFVASDATKGWETAVNYVGLVGNFTTSAPILTRIEPGHKNMTYTPAEKASMLAAAISEAMNNTAAGLFVAITLLLSHMFLESKTTSLIDSLEIAVVKFLNSITERYSEPAAPSPQPGMTPRAPAPRPA